MEVAKGVTHGRRSNSRRRWLVFVCLIAASGQLAACSDRGMASGEVVLYTSIPDSVVTRLEGVVEQRFPDLDGNIWLSEEGISLRVVRGRTADIQRRIASEIESGGVKADVIWLAEPSPYETYKSLGILAPYQAPAEAPIPDLYVDQDGFYVAARVISMVLAWNTSQWLNPLSDWPDLHNIENAAFPAPASGASRATIKALTDHYGDAFFADLAASGATSVSSNGAARDGLTEGRFNAVAVLDYMARNARATGSAIDYAYPASGTVVIPSPIAITANAANPEAARAFVDFILSQPGQKIMVEIGNFYPVRTDVALPYGAPPLDAIGALDIDWNSLSAEVDAINERWEELFGPPSGT